jgi:hypothetical protein
MNAAQALDHDVRCHACGYNLRGLSSQGRCPECGAGVAESLNGAELLASQRWQAQVRSGANQFLVATVLSPICIGLALLWLMTEAHALATGFLIVAFVWTFVADFRASRMLILDQPPQVGVQSGPMLIAWSVAAAAGLVMLAIAAVIGSSDRRFMNNGAPLVLAPAAIGYALLTIGVPRFVPLYYRLAILARFIHARGLARWAKIHAWCKVVSDGALVFCCAAALILFLMPGDSADDLGIIFAFGALFALPGYAAVWIPSLIFAILLRLRIGRCGDARPLGFAPVMLIPPRL